MKSFSTSRSENPDPRAAVVGDDRRAIVQDHLSEAVGDRAETAGAERMEIPDAGPVPDEEIDTALADASLARLGPGGQGRQIAHRAETRGRRRDGLMLGSFEC